MDGTLTVLEGVTVGLAACDERAGVLAAACARAVCDARARACTALALEAAGAECVVWDLTGDTGAAPAFVAVCADCRPLSASAALGAGGATAVLGIERATRSPMMTAAEVLSTRAARHHMIGRGALEAVGRASAA